MTETAFLDAVAAYLVSADLDPAPDSVGVAEPEGNADLPIVVLSLEESTRQGTGLGERSELITDDVLEWHEEIDLANSVLPADPDFDLVDEDRLGMFLPHGGLVRSDGSPGPLEEGDIEVSVDGDDRSVATADPEADEFTVDPIGGRLTFGQALPGSGTLAATYFLSQWERRVSRLSGVLRVDVGATSAEDARQLSDSVLTALTAPAAATDIERLLSLAPISVSSISRPGEPPQMRLRTLRLRFSFEHRIDRPESSGGVIARVAVQSRLNGGRPPGSPAGEEEMEVSSNSEG